MSPHIRFFGVPVTLRPIALGAGLLSALTVGLVMREQRVALAAAAGALWYVADGAHVLGHIISSKAVGAPLDAIDFGVYPMSVYHNNDVSPAQHIGRSCGGVGVSLLATLLLFALRRRVTHPLLHRLLTIMLAQHTFLAAASLLPIRQVDGGVIYANLPELWR